nr:MAG TPA: hypothetical protein [Caudoviricetes sp.]
MAAWLLLLMIGLDRLKAGIGIWTAHHYIRA